MSAGRPHLHNEESEPKMRMSRGVWIMGLASTLFTIFNVFLTFILYELMCLEGPRTPGSLPDSCTDLGSFIAGGNLTSLLITNAYLLPCLGVMLGVWIWMLADLRRLRAARLLPFVYVFPVIVLVTGIAITLLTSLQTHGALIVRVINLWYGSFALALWPLLVTLVALFWRRSTQPAQSEAAPGPV